MQRGLETIMGESNNKGGHYKIKVPKDKIKLVTHEEMKTLHIEAASKLLI